MYIFTYIDEQGYECETLLINNFGQYYKVPLESYDSLFTLSDSNQPIELDAINWQLPDMIYSLPGHYNY